MKDIKDCKNFKMVAEAMDFSAIRAELEANPELWKEDTYLRNFPQGPFASMETIMIRFPEHAMFATQAEADAFLATRDPHESVWQPPLPKLPSVYKAVMQLLQYTEGTRLGRVMINKVSPGGSIFRHADTPVHANYYTRFHIVVKSKPGNDFHSDDEITWIPEGSIVAFKNQLEHEVHNNSDEDRIHIVVDIRAELYHGWKFSI